MTIASKKSATVEIEKQKDDYTLISKSHNTVMQYQEHHRRM